MVEEGRRRIGVVRARSAAARRVTGEMACRVLCSESSIAAEIAIAHGMGHEISQGAS